MTDSNDFEEKMITEFRQLALKISEAQEIIQTLAPKHQKLADLIKTYGLDAQVDDLLDDADPEKSQKKGAKIAHEVSLLFRANGNAWMRLSDIHDYLLANGIKIGGRNPNSNLSAHLSNAGGFEVQRAKGWRLEPSFFNDLEQAESKQ
ncbi:hypothetical protein ACFQ14_10555 [Pseudahrensia aquimaris]|uniref:Uncharacterized protein n=1 Tax=Pseudahrensia aquimaris TaxID=744461 RepID=A0ABW3FEE7_9HYPH